MVWSNWQGAIWRGAGAVLLCWSGLAWTQTSTPRAAVDSADRIMVVHENGKSTRCRVIESWQLPDGKVAHLLESLESGERITIVDEQGPSPETVRNPRAMPKRIFAWGKGRQTPPEGSPLPPHLRIDSGVVIKNETPAPTDAVITPGPVVVNRGVDEKAIGGRSDVRTEGPITIIESNPLPKQPTLLNRLLAKRETRPQVVDFSKSEAPSGPMVINETPMVVAPPTVAAPPSVLPIEKPMVPTIQPVVPTPMDPTLQPVLPNPGIPALPPTLTEPRLPPPLVPSTEPQATPTLPGETKCDPAKPEPRKTPETAKKGWRPGANIQAWLHGKPNADPRVIAANDVKDVKNAQRAEDFLSKQNKVIEKQTTEKIEKTYGTPFSTARLPGATGVVPEVKKPEPSPLAIAKTPERPITLPPAPAVPAAPKEEGKQAKDMWGNPLLTPAVPPGKSVLEPARANDPLLSPEKLVRGDDHLKGKAPVVPAAILPPPPLSGPTNWPLGTQSVQAAHSGLLGQPMYIPVPTVTVPLPHTPPTPPTPKLEAPNLNTYVNAFTPPPAPKGAQQPLPMQGMFTAPPMTPPMMHPPGMMQQPMMNPQQMLAQQQMMAQHQMMIQQQMLMQYGYRPMMNPYVAQAMPSQGPMANFSRHYAGPLPPNPTGSYPMQAGYAPAAYPMAAPMQPQSMMPQPPVQPVGYQQPTQPQSVTQQVEQLIKVMRESPYPAQREWAAQSLASFEWRVHPQIVPALLQSASQDPAASVRAGCVYCLGRMNAAVEPVFGTLHSMRNDTDPRVRQEVEQAFARLGQTPMGQ